MECRVTHFEQDTFQFLDLVQVYCSLALLFTPNGLSHPVPGSSK